MDEILKRLKEAGQDDIAKLVQAEVSKRNDENKDLRQKRSDNDKIVAEILATLGTDNKNEVVDRISTSANASNEVKALQKQIDTITGKLTEETKAKDKAKIAESVTSALQKKKVTSNFDFMKDALTGMVSKGESGLLVGDSTLDDYIQAMIDKDGSLVKPKDKKESKKSGDLYTEQELSTLSPDEQEKNADKVAKSIAAL